MQEFEVIFYDKPDGTEPVKDFLDSLDTKMRAKMLRTVLLLAENGTQLREPYSKPFKGRLCGYVYHDGTALLLCTE